MQRYYPHKPLQTIPCRCGNSVAVVLASDAEAAIAAARAEQIADELCKCAEQFVAGERDMLNRCIIAAVNNSGRGVAHIIAALRALEASDA
jgi:hypothetical protein